MPSISTDKNKLMQILINLFLNAKDALLKGHQSPKCLAISAKITDNFINITIHDNGIGISPENLPRLFSFGFSTKKEGQGFGLHNCALLAKEINGSLAVKSDGIDQGASFILSLPK